MRRASTLLSESCGPSRAAPEEPLFQRDYILRMVEQAAQAIARALGLLAQDKPEEAEHALALGYSALGFDRHLIGVLDAATFARQLGDDERIAAAVRLLLCDAELCERRSDLAGSKRRLRLAAGLVEQLSTPAPSLQSELDAALEQARSRQ